MYYNKQKPSIIHYRKFKDFNNDSFLYKRSSDSPNKII